MVAYLKSLPVGLRMNPPRKADYFAEWFAVMSWDGLRRRLSPGKR